MEAAIESKSNLSLIIPLPDAATDARDPECSITALCALVKAAGTISLQNPYPVHFRKR